MKTRTFAACFLALAAATASAEPNAGERVDWQLIGGSGTSGSSTNYQVNGSLGQAVAGFVDGSTIDVNQGYWQNFIGPACCVGVTGNINTVGIIDLTDLSLLVAYLVIPAPGNPVLPCPAEANVNNTGIIDLTDLSLLVAYLVIPAPNTPALPSCP